MAEKTNTHAMVAIRGRPTNATESADFIIHSALKAGASDIHIGLNTSGKGSDPYMLRFRVNGKLQVIPGDFLTTCYKETIARFKVLACIPSTDVGVPQDGQINVSTGAGSVVLRIATLPSNDIEEIVIRIQKGNEAIIPFDNLQMSKEMMARMKGLIQQRSGMIILNGPAGSGKTSTIYSIIRAIASPERKVVTAEDPVEARLPYVSHTQVTGKTTFASLGRAFMRQDAEVIFIGEVRDAESAQAAVQLAQTGHLVLTTIHTRDAIGVIGRLEALEIPANYIASALIGSLSQRLVPRICPQCRVEYKPDDQMLQNLAKIYPVPQGARIYKSGPGCAQCSGGFAGRMPIFELLVVDSDIADMINRKSTRNDLLNAARRKGMRTLAEDALMRVYAGYLDITSVQSFVFGPDYQMKV